MKNPFEFGRPVGEIELVDRQSELRAVKDALVNGQKLWLIGPRRYGKTSILVAAQEQLRAQNAIVLRFNLEEFATPDALARAIVLSAARFDWLRRADRAKHHALFRAPETVAVGRSSGRHVFGEPGIIGGRKERSGSFGRGATRIGSPGRRLRFDLGRGVR